MFKLIEHVNLKNRNCERNTARVYACEQVSCRKNEQQKQAKLSSTDS